MIRLKIIDEHQYKQIKKQLESAKDTLSREPKDVVERNTHETVKQSIGIFEDAVKDYERRTEKQRIGNKS